ncbi:response regulator transcription factor [Sulfurospirillum diekertiae]|uniref:Response regulator MprA n=1 Tax=Sulfurospirillum diekertiae TaxID=1854492 RepID=A0A1Y0HJN0_9BACT|nr:response regulator transcription factor [Sulfurospirillum diekertiae]ARU48262.1 Response regulator MprA [Sulfurospirillum diekertiae]ASC93104.1 Response regulator MprA [Sulfurospirillum diekertiae]
MDSSLLVLKNKRILFAEDDLTTRIQLTNTLKMLFGKVYCAKDGEEAYNLYEDEQPDIILTDVQMPKKDGIKLTRQIRQIDYTLPIVILTSFDDRNLLLSAANLAIDGYLIKPIEFTVLVKTLSQALKRTQKENLIRLNESLVFNYDTKEFYHHNKLKVLGSKELELIEFLLKNPYKIVSKEILEAKLWNYEVQCASAVKNLVLRIRKKLGNNVIVSMKGIGYRLNIDNAFMKKYQGGRDLTSLLTLG